MLLERSFLYPIARIGAQYKDWAPSGYIAIKIKAIKSGNKSSMNAAGLTHPAVM